MVTTFGNVTVEILVILKGRKGDTVNEGEGAESRHKKVFPLVLQWLNSDGQFQILATLQQCDLVPVHMETFHVA